MNGCLYTIEEACCLKKDSSLLNEKSLKFDRNTLNYLINVEGQNVSV